MRAEQGFPFAVRWGRKRVCEGVAPDRVPSVQRVPCNAMRSGGVRSRGSRASDDRDTGFGVVQEVQPTWGIDRVLIGFTCVHKYKCQLVRRRSSKRTFRTIFNARSRFRTGIGRQPSSATMAQFGKQANHMARAIAERSCGPVLRPYNLGDVSHLPAWVERGGSEPRVAGEARQLSDGCSALVMLLRAGAACFRHEPWARSWRDIELAADSGTGPYAL